MKTFEQLYCERFSCDASRFASSVFRAALPWHARLLAPFFGGIRGKYFEPDRELIAAAGEATSIERIRAEIRDFFASSANRRYLRLSLRIRVSTRRLQTIARRCGVPEFGSAAEVVFR